MGAKQSRSGRQIIPQTCTSKDPTIIGLSIGFTRVAMEISYLHQTAPHYRLWQLHNQTLPSPKKKCISQSTCLLLLACPVLKPESGGREAVGNWENECLDSRKVWIIICLKDIGKLPKWLLFTIPLVSNCTFKHLCSVLKISAAQQKD